MVSLLEEVDEIKCRVHHYDYKYAFVNDFLMRTVPKKKLSEGWYEVSIRRIEDQTFTKFRVCRECMSHLRLLFDLRRNSQDTFDDYPCLLDLELGTDIYSKFRPGISKIGCAGLPSDMKLRWRDFIVYVKHKYHDEEKLQEVSTSLKSMLNVTQDMINSDKAWFSEDDYLSKTRGREASF
jgi:hypothetical protein